MKGIYLFADDLCVAIRAMLSHQLANVPFFYCFLFIFVGQQHKFETAAATGTRQVDAGTRWITVDASLAEIVLRPFEVDDQPLLLVGKTFQFDIQFAAHKAASTIGCRHVFGNNLVVPLISLDP